MSVQSFIRGSSARQAQHAILILSPPLMPPSSVSNLPLLLRPCLFSPSLSLFTQECAICGSADGGVRCSCFALARRPDEEEVVKNNPAATSTHASFITSLSTDPVTITHLTYFYGLSPSCLETLMHISGRACKAESHHVNLGECRPTACISSLKPS